jgi:SAM-dependent methyltransferase
MRMSDDSHVLRNRKRWNDLAASYAGAGEANWARGEPVWGIFDVPERTLRMLPEDMTAMRALELGCGTAYVSAWMARRGARVTAMDLSEQQLETARRLQELHGVELEIVQGNCEELPFENASFDFAISEYGAAIWCRPESWLREAFRVLRPGGALHFLGCSPWVHVCSPKSGELPLVHRFEHDYFDQNVIDWGDEGVEFNLPMSGWFRFFREVGWEVVDFLEPRPEAPGTERRYYATLDWGYRYPAEQVWKLRKPPKEAASNGAR